MYFGKTIPEWITEHQNDSVTLGEVVRGCEQARQCLEELLDKSLNSKRGSSDDLVAAAYFEQRLEHVYAPVDMVLSILGERYGYPENPTDKPEDDADTIDADIQAADMAADDMPDNDVLGSWE